MLEKLDKVENWQRLSHPSIFKEIVYLILAVMRRLDSLLIFVS